jgi:hypothetical protein
MKRWKSRLWAVVAALSMTVLREVRAEPLGSPCFRAGGSEPRANLSLATRFGVSTAPFYTASFPSVRGHGLVASLCGTYPIGAVELGFTVPGALISIEQPAGAYVDEVTWGNPSWVLRYRPASRQGDGHTLGWFSGVGVALPLAEHGAPGALLSNRALALASAFEGWRDQDSYVPGRFSLVPHGGLEFASLPWRFEASLELPLLFEVSDADLPEDSDAAIVGFAPVIHSGIDVRVADWFVPGLDADLVLNAVPPVEGARSKIEPLEFVLRPELSFPLRGRLLLSADFVVPIAGSLAGSTFSGSLRVTKSF